jgi:Type VI secretion system VasI, EvfG, VC_A0118
MMRRILRCASAITFATALVQPTAAQAFLETLAGLKFCRTFKDDTQRLKCFDEVLPEKPSKQLSPNSPDDLEITWTIKETKSPIDDMLEVSGTLVAVGSDARLVLRCKEKETDVMFHKPFAFLGIEESVKVLVRIDGGQPIETMWLPSTNRQGAYAPSAIQFIRALPDKGKLFVRAFGYGGNNVDGEFKLGNVSEVRQKIALSCKWPGEGPKGSRPTQVSPPP